MGALVFRADWEVCGTWGALIDGEAGAAFAPGAGLHVAEPPLENIAVEVEIGKGDGRVFAAFGEDFAFGIDDLAACPKSER